MADDKKIRFIFSRESHYIENTMDSLNRISCVLNTYLQNDEIHFKIEEEYAYNNIKTESIVIKKEKNINKYNKFNYKIYNYSKLSNVISSNDSLNRHKSMPVLKRGEFKNQTKISKILNNTPYSFYNSHFIVNNCCQTCDKSECINPFINPFVQAQIYRCQLNTQEDSCCCSCNSDSMFEVMKSLYDCYKKKNCDHCNCILCGHLPREERRLGEVRKSGVEMAAVGIDTASIKELKKETKKAKAAGLLSPLEGKTLEQKEKIMRGLAKAGISLPETKTASEKELSKRIRTELGLPPEPKTDTERETYKKAEAAGLLRPLEGLTTPQKETMLRKQAQLGISLPVGRTASEKELIQKIKASAGVPPGKIPSEKILKAKEEGLLTPLQGKSQEQKEKIIRGLAAKRLALPEAKTDSEKKLIDKVRKELGLPPEPKTASSKEQYQKALIAGIITPLEGKSRSQKEKILRAQAEAGLSLPEGRTASEKALIDKVKATATSQPPMEMIVPKVTKIPSEKLQKAKAAGLLTPLEGKTQEQKEKILRGLAKSGMPLPEGKTTSEKNLIQKVRAEIGLPPAPKTPSHKVRMSKAMAAGIITPLEGKSPAQKEKILKSMFDAGIPLPEGRTPSEKALVAKIKTLPSRPPSVKVPSEKMRKAKAAGFLTPLDNKTTEQKEKILRGLASHGIPLPTGKTASEKKLVDKVRADMGLPLEPKTSSARRKYNSALAAGIITPLEGKSSAQKEKILLAQAEAGLALPEGRTVSEKALISKVKETIKPRPSSVSAEAKIPTKVKVSVTAPAPPSGKVPVKTVPEVGRVPSEKRPLGDGTGRPALASDKLKKLDQKTAKVMKEGKGPANECICGLLTPDSERGRVSRTSKVTPPSRITSEKLKAAKAAGLFTPLTGKSHDQKERIIRGLAKQGLPLPEAQTASEKKIIDKVRAETGLPPEPRTPSIKQKYAKAQAAGFITPLDGKSPSQKEKILRGQAEMGLILPEGRTPSEKDLIAKVKVTAGLPLAGRMPSDKLRKSKAGGLHTPLEGKTPEQKEKILKGLAKAGLPLPEGKSSSEKNLIQKVRKDMGLPLEPKSASQKRRMSKTLESGIVTSLKGKTYAQKEKILKSMADAGIPLPEGRTASEKALITKVKAFAPSPPSLKVPSDKMRKAKAAGLLTPLEGKSTEQKEKILRGLAAHGIPLPVSKTKSDKVLIDKIRKEFGLPPEPDSVSQKEKYQKAQAAGIITPLEGKSAAEKEKVLKRMHDAGLSLPEGRTASEKSLIQKIKEAPARLTSSKKLRAAKAAGLLTPLEGKSPEQKEKILRGLAAHGIPLPLSKTKSDKALIDKIRKETGLPPEPDTISQKEKYQKAQAAGLITPLEGKTAAEKENVLKRMHDAGLSLPEGRTASEKSLIQKVKAAPAIVTPSKKLRSVKAAGLLTPLEGKSAEQKEKILRGLLQAGLPLPEGKTVSEKSLIKKIKSEVEKRRLSKAETIKYKPSRAIPLGLSALTAEAAKLDKKTAKGMKEGKGPSDECICSLLTPESDREAVRGKPGVKSPSKTYVKTASPIPSEKLRKAKADGLLTPLQGKTTAQKEKILRGLLDVGLPLPEAKTDSEKELVKKILQAAGLPSEVIISQRKRIKSKSRGVGVTQESTMKVAKAVAVTAGKSKGGIVEELQDITKTTTCEQACGCDRKKIRFKHSYVKIRVTSPDISSFCPCPDECVPGVKSGVFVDNEGIKVTVGSAVGVPSFTKTPNIIHHYPSDVYSDLSYISVYSATTDSDEQLRPYVNTYGSFNCENAGNTELQYAVQSILSHTTESLTSLQNACLRSESSLHTDEHSCEKYHNISIRTSIELRKTDKPLDPYVTNIYGGDSDESIYLLKTDSSLSLSSNSYYSKLCSISVISLIGSNFSDSNYSCYLNRENIIDSSNTINSGSRDNVTKIKYKNNCKISQCNFVQDLNLKCGNSAEVNVKDTIMIYRADRKKNKKKKKMNQTDEDVEIKAETLDEERILIIGDINSSMSPDIMKCYFNRENIIDRSNTIDSGSKDNVTKIKNKNNCKISQCNFVQDLNLKCSNSAEVIVKDTIMIYRADKKKNKKKEKINQTDEDVGMKTEALDEEPILIIGDINSSMSSDIMKLVNDILSREPISNSRSIFVLVSSDDHNTNSFLDFYGSTIALQLSHDFSNGVNTNIDSSPKYGFDTEWNDIPKKLFPVVQGIKVAKKSKTITEDHIMSMKSVTQKQKYKDITVEKQCRAFDTPSKEIIRKPYSCNVETDTTIDRPCCCQILDRLDKGNLSVNDTNVATMCSTIVLVGSEASGPTWTNLIKEERKSLVTDTTVDGLCCCKGSEKHNVKEVAHSVIRKKQDLSIDTGDLLRKTISDRRYFNDTRPLILLRNAVVSVVDRIGAIDNVRPTIVNEMSEQDHLDLPVGLQLHLSPKNRKPIMHANENALGLEPGLKYGSSVKPSNSITKEAPGIPPTEDIIKKKYHYTGPCNPCSRPYYSRVPGATKGAKLEPLQPVGPDYGQDKINQFKDKIYERYHKMQGLEQMPHAQNGGMRFSHSRVPCFQPIPPLQYHGTEDVSKRGVILAVGEGSGAIADVLPPRDMKCHCKRGKKDVNKPCTCQSVDRMVKLKNRECDCPPEQRYIDSDEDTMNAKLEYASYGDIVKFKSDMTQATSGFKVKVMAKRPVEEDMSFEDALKYFGEGSDYDIQQGGCYHLVPETGVKDRPHAGCCCEDKAVVERLMSCDTPNVICECPYVPPPPSSPPPPCTPFEIPEVNEDYLGIKFTVGGKGSGSQGLSGVCCFDLLVD